MIAATTAIQTRFIIPSRRRTSSSDQQQFGIETGEPARIAGIFHSVGSDFTVLKATRGRINAFGIEFEGKSGLSKSEFSWAA